MPRAVVIAAWILSGPQLRPGATTDGILQATRAEMEPVLARTRFSKPIYEDAARKLVTAPRQRTRA